uniref:Midnolin n=1 Tax=Anas platyrhynchos platyrhynchos TaxID=8840 RepID=A0A493SYF4_ANAPP
MSSPAPPPHPCGKAAPPVPPPGGGQGGGAAAAPPALGVGSWHRAGVARGRGCARLAASLARGGVAPSPPAPRVPGEGTGGTGWPHAVLTVPLPSPSPQVNDFLSGRSPLTLALRVGDHMMFVQLQLAAQQSSGQLQHRHVIASRGEAGAAASPHSEPGPQPHARHASPPPVYCNAPHPAPVTAGMFRSHGASTQTVNSSVDCSTRSGSPPGSSPAPSARSRKPGAVIESFVNHAPGVFSGTFSGTLHPNCQDSSGRPRRDIGTILQILNDLLSATRHYQGMPQSLAQLRCQTQFSSSSSSSSSSSPPSSPDLATKTTSEPLPAAAASPPLHPVVQCQSQIRMCKPSGDRLRQTENRATRCKVERLQLLMQQKRLRRKARRDARAPYHWLPNRKSSRTNSNSSVSSEGSLDLDFEDSVWKPEVKADIKSEFVVA